MNFNEFYLNSFKDSNDILDGSNVIIKGNVAVNKLNPTQHIDVSGNIKASNKLILYTELSGTISPLIIVTILHPTKQNSVIFSRNPRRY